MSPFRQLKVVTKRAFTQILEKRPECNQEFDNVCQLERQLVSSIASVQKGRQGLIEARKKFTASSLGILAAYRRRQRAAVLLGTWSMSRLTFRFWKSKNSNVRALKVAKNQIFVPQNSLL